MTTSRIRIENLTERPICTEYHTNGLLMSSHQLLEEEASGRPERMCF